VLTHFHPLVGGLVGVPSLAQRVHHEAFSYYARLSPVLRFVTANVAMPISLATAAKLAGLLRVPVVVRDVAPGQEKSLLEMALIENIQREDLNPIEAARAFERLMDEFHLTQDAVAERTGKDRATVANAIRLLKLDKQIQEWIEEGKLSAGHGRALLAVPEQQLRMRYAHRASRGALTVRQIEKLAARRAQGKQPHPPAPAHLDANIKNALEELQRHLGTRISLRQRTKIRPGQLVLEFYDDKQLMGLYDRLMK